jgi:hypothetical protein
MCYYEESVRCMCVRGSYLSIFQGPLGIFCVEKLGKITKLKTSNLIRVI